MMTTPPESEGCNGGDDISRSNTQYHRKHYQQEESAPLTSYQQVANQMLTGIESVNRNHSLTSTASPSLTASVGAQESPRIGIVPPRPTPPAATQTYTRIENAAFLATVRKQAKCIRCHIRYDPVCLPNLEDFPEVNELMTVMEWQATTALDWYRLQLDKTRSYIVRAGGLFDYRRETWVWRIVERHSPLGTFIEVFSTTATRATMIARKRWEALP